MAENTTTAATDTEAANTLNDERARRLADRAALYAAGKNPYPEHSDVTDHAADLLSATPGSLTKKRLPRPSPWAAVSWRSAARARSCSSSCATPPPTSSSSAA